MFQCGEPAGGEKAGRGDDSHQFGIWAGTIRRRALKASETFLETVSGDRDRHGCVPEATAASEQSPRAQCFRVSGLSR